jgi:hypothetical protein
MDRYAELRGHFPENMPVPANFPLTLAAHMLGLSRASMYKLEERGDLVLEKVLGKTVATAESLNDLLAERRAARESGAGNGRPLRRRAAGGA